MLVTVYDNQRLHNVTSLGVRDDNASYMVDILIGLNYQLHPITFVATSQEQYLELNRVCTNFVADFIRIECQSKILNKNLYKSWRGAMMTLSENIKSIGCEMLTELGYALNIVGYHASKDYQDNKLYMKYTKIKDKNMYFIANSVLLLENECKLILNTTLNTPIEIDYIEDDQSFLSILKNFTQLGVKEDTANDTKIKLVSNFVTSYEFEIEMVKRGFITLQEMEELIQTHTGFKVSVRRSTYGDST